MKSEDMSNPHWVANAATIPNCGYCGWKPILSKTSDPVADVIAHCRDENTNKGRTTMLTAL